MQNTSIGGSGMQIDLMEAVKILWPVLQAWSDSLPEWNPTPLPDQDVLDYYYVVYQRNEPGVNGSFSGSLKEIFIDPDITRHNLMAVLIHELVHLAQYEDNQGNYENHYKLMKARHGYENCTYEVEARVAEGLYHYMFRENEEFKERVIKLFKKYQQEPD